MHLKRKGTALIVTLGILTVLSVMGSTFVLLMRTEKSATENYKMSLKAKLLARDGVVTAGTKLQTMLTHSYYSSLYNTSIPAEFRSWAFGVDPTTGDYKKSGTYTYEVLGAMSMTDNLAPVCFPYPDINMNKCYIDNNGNKSYDAGTDTYLEEIDPDITKAVFYYNPPSAPGEARSLFTGFSADGHYEGASDVLAGTYLTGGDRFKLKIIETNSQLSINYLSRTLYDFLVNDTSTVPTTPGMTCEGSQFKYMLYFLGQGIVRVLGPKIAAELGTAVNPFDTQVINDLYALKLSFGSELDAQQFSSKTQIRDIIEQYHPGYWKYVRDFITISAWPAYDVLYAYKNKNTIVPGVRDVDAYKQKLGEYNSGSPASSTRPAITKVNVEKAVQPPIDVNTASLPVIYSACANLSGDARFWYFSPDDGSGTEALEGGEPDVDAYITATEIKRAKRIWRGNEKTLISSSNPDGKTNFYAVKYGSTDSNESKIRRFRQFDFDYINGKEAATLFNRNYHLMHYINISPFRALWSTGTASGVDYAWNLARLITELRPFTSWADFEKRLIDKIIIDSKGAAPSSLQVCEKFSSFWHPWHTGSPGGSDYGDIDQTYFEWWYYQAVADLLKANFNPTPKLTRFNPDAAYYQVIDRADLVYWTVPFIFNNPGIFEITSVGEIIGNVFDPSIGDYVPKPMVQKQYHSVIKVAEIVRHHTQEHFCTGFPHDPGDFGTNSGDPNSFYSVVRLTAHENVGLRNYSFTTTYPQSVNEDSGVYRVKDHERAQRGTKPAIDQRTYNTGWYSGRLHMPRPETEMLYGPNTPYADFGYVTVRPQDTGPFDYETRTDTSSSAYLGAPNGVSTNAYATGSSPGADALELSASNADNDPPAKYLNFWMPFNETLDTISHWAGESNYGHLGGGEMFQSARIGSVGNNYTNSSGNAKELDAVSSGLAWNPDGFTFRAYDYLGVDSDFPTYLEYPSGVGYYKSTSDFDLKQIASGSPYSADGTSSYKITSYIPHKDINDQVAENDKGDCDEAKAATGSDGIHKADQWRRQKETNMPYYRGTIDFWFKSDVDQWDMAAPGYKSEQDTIYGGFFNSTVLVHCYHGKAANRDGIQGIQTFIVREMYNTFRVSRIYFVDAVLGTPGANTFEGRWCPETISGAGQAGYGHRLSIYLYEHGDTCPDTMGQDSDFTNDGVYDTSDLGPMFARVDSWLSLENLKSDFNFLWRPHEWYHLGFSFKSDSDSGINPDTAVNFFINGIHVDKNYNSNYPMGKMNAASFNDGAIVDGQTPNNTMYTNLLRKWGSTINDVFEANATTKMTKSAPTLVIGAVKRNQMTEQQMNQYKAAAGTWAVDELHREMFLFGSGPFVAPCNGTIDAFRITSKYFDRSHEDLTNYERVNAFARYNTYPGNPNTAYLGSYENGFANIWERDIRIANISWTEYRPKWDSAASLDISYNNAPYIGLEFRSYNDRSTSTVNLSNGFGCSGPNQYSVPSSPASPFKAQAANWAAWASEGVESSGVAFPGNPTTGADKFIIPASGCFTYTARFYSNGISASNSAAILDEITITILSPITIFSFQEIFDF